MGVDKRWALWRRIEFTKGEVEKLKGQIEYALSQDINDPFKLELENRIANEKLETMISLIKEMKACEKRMKEIDKPQPEPDITPEMIAQAKAYPIEKLIHFVKGSAIAFCHDDKSPSLTWDKKRNRAKCWPCDKSFDSIAVLCERDGYKFKEAVRELERR